MIHVAEFPVAVHFFQLFYGSVITVADADVQHQTPLVGFFGHFAGEGVVDGDGLFAEDVLAGLQSVHGDGVVGVVGGQNPDGLNLVVLQSNLIVGNDLLDQGEFFLGLFCLFQNQIASVFDTGRILHFCHSSQVYLCDASASDNGDHVLFHSPIPSFSL